jgi:exopolysaccharide biosynthesis polyprenyl glycosylphosphotransferase
LFDRHRRKAAVLFAVADVVLTVLAFEGAYQTRVFLPLPRVFFILVPVKALLLGVTLVLWVLIGHWIGAYDRLYGNNLRAAVYDTVRQVLLGVLGLVAFQYMLQLEISRLFIALFAAYNTVLLIVYRASAGRLRGYIRRQFGAETYYVVVGSGPKAIALGRQLEAAHEFGIQLLFFVDPSGGMGDTVKLDRTYTVRQVGDLEQMLRRNVIDEIVFTVDTQTLAQMEELFLLCDEEGVRTRVVIDFFPHVNSEVFLDRFGKTPLLTFSTTPHDEIQLFLKRTFDVAASAGALAVLALPLALVALLIRVTSRGPALFRQVRCGLNGRRFTFYKFRSMVEGAEGMLDDVAHLNERDGPVFKIANDPRLTAIGRYLRRYSVDEWPQFWNVLRGDMSLVGPRPAVPSEVEHCKIWQRRRLRMRPGLTCLWALQGRDKVDFERWMRLDLEYIDTWSLTLDFKILMQSIPRVLAGEGAS